MNDFLFNVALVLLATNAAIQFCAQALALYANESAIHEIWGNQVGQGTCLTFIATPNTRVLCAQS